MFEKLITELVTAAARDIAGGDKANALASLENAVSYCEPTTELVTEMRSVTESLPIPTELDADAARGMLDTLHHHAISAGPNAAARAMLLD